MVVNVTLLTAAASRGSVVRFRAYGGEARAIWMGDPCPSGFQVDIEFDVPGEVCWADVSIADQELPAFSVRHEHLVLSGLMEDVDKDGVITLRIGDSIILVDTIGQPSIGITGKIVCVKVKELKIHPTDL